MATGTRRGTLIGITVVGLVLLWAAPAIGHPVLLSTTPVSESVLEAPPQTVELRFTEPVSADLGGVRILNSSGTRLDGAVLAQDDPTGVSVGLAGNQAAGTYFVAWRVTSVDGHTLHGTFSYSVGSPTELTEDTVAQLLASEDDRTLNWAAGAMRWLLYVTTLMAAGGAIFLLYVHDGRGSEWSVLTRLVAIAAGAAVLLTAIATAVQAALVTGRGVSAVFQPSVAAGVLASTYGRSVVLRAVSLIVLIGTIRRSRAMLMRQIAAFGGLAALASFALEGHSATSRPPWLSMGADVAHLVAAATWFGGLVLLFVALRHHRARNDPAGAARVVGRFSAAAGDSVLAMTVAGISLAWIEVQTPRALVSSTYGLTLIVKAGLVAVVLAIAAHNQRRVVPRIVGPGRDAEAPAKPLSTEGVASGDTQAPWNALRRTLRLEVMALIAVLVVTAVLVNLVPARQSLRTDTEAAAAR